jgi:hypothetical protein
MDRERELARILNSSVTGNDLVMALVDLAKQLWQDHMVREAMYGFFAEPFVMTKSCEQNYNALDTVLDLIWFGNEIIFDKELEPMLEENLPIDSPVRLIGEKIIQ